MPKYILNYTPLITSSASRQLDHLQPHPENKKYLTEFSRILHEKKMLSGKRTLPIIVSPRSEGWDIQQPGGQHFRAEYDNYMNNLFEFLRLTRDMQRVVVVTGVGEKNNVLGFLGENFTLTIPMFGKKLDYIALASGKNNNTGVFYDAGMVGKVLELAEKYPFFILLGRRSSAEMLMEELPKYFERLACKYHVPGLANKIVGLASDLLIYDQ